MDIEWKTKNNQSPYLSIQQAEWEGLKVRRAHVLSGILPEQCDESHQIHITLLGELQTKKISSNGKAATIKRSVGDMCITPAGQVSSAQWENPMDNLGLAFDPEFISRTAIENHFSSRFELFEFPENKDSLITNIGLTLLMNSDSETLSGKIYTESLIQTLVLHLLKNYSTAELSQGNVNGGLSGYKLRRVREYIAENLDKDLGLAEIAEIAGLSRFHFARSFRKTTGLTPQQFLMQQRIERAKELLAKKDLPLVEISLRTGFKNQSHFTTLFRKFTKFTPKTWRELKHA